MPLRVVAIVEGHGEDDGAVRTLLERTWYELLNGDFIEIIPWRAKQGQLLKAETLAIVVEATAIALHATEDENMDRLLLILIDSEGECPADRGRRILELATAVRSDTTVSCVVPNPMFETWFAASARSLRGKNGLPDDLVKPKDPEGEGIGKSWLKKHLPRKYKETVDQPRFVGHMDLGECFKSSRSFRKLCKELARFVSDPTEEPNVSSKRKRKDKGGGKAL